MKNYIALYILALTLLLANFSEAQSQSKTLKSSNNSAKAEVAKTISSTRLISYYQWASLSTSQKTAYINGIRGVYVSWEKHQSRYNISAGSDDPVTKWAVLQDLLQLPRAVAAEGDNNCESKTFHLKRKANNVYDLCVRVRTSFWSSYMSCLSEGGEAEAATKACPNQFSAFVQDQRPKVIRYELAELEKYATRFGTPSQAPPVAESSAAPAAAAAAASSAGSQVAAPKNDCHRLNFELKKSGNGNYDLCVKVTDTAVAWKQDTYCLSSNKKVENAISTCNDRFNEFVTKSRSNLRPGPYLTAVEQYATRFGASGAIAKDLAANSTSTSSGSCDSGYPNCGSSKELANTKALQQAYRDEVETDFSEGQRPCVVAGFISVLNSKKKCQPIRELKIGAWTGKCSNNQVMCNPLMFGFQEDASPLCVPVGQHVTSECNLKAGSIGNTAEVVSRQITAQSGLAGLEGVTTDDFADLWQKHRISLNTLCTKETARLRYFCTECTSMIRQVRDMNMASTCSDACGDVPSDDASLCRDSFKSRSNTPAVDQGTQ